VGGVIEPRNHIEVRGADVLPIDGRQYRQRRFRESLVAPRGQRSQARTQVSMRENREIPWSPVVPTDASSYGFAG
jgi:hypothetical protein